MRALIRLYPTWWRTRYGDEFEALLAERPLGPFDVADVVLAALDARLHLRGPAAESRDRRGLPLSLRLGGAAAALGGLLWSTGLIVSFVAGEAWKVPGAMVLLIGSILLLVALIGLSAFQSRRHPALVWSGFALPAVGSVAAIVGMVLMATVGDQPVVAGLSPWAIWSLGMLGTVAGSILFAVATFRTGALSRSAAALLGIGSAAFLAVIAVGFAGIVAEFAAAFGLALIAFSAGWIALGTDAIRRDRPAATSPA